MSLVDDVLRYNSVSIVGTAKNTGKTVCLNYLLRNIPSAISAGVTSIGVDGESTDAVTNTSKPEVFLKQGMYFNTSETHYRDRQLVSEIVGLSTISSSLGRYVTARVICDGNIKLSGPSSINDLIEWKNKAKQLPISLFLIDGAASRLSSASPYATDAFILCTGAAAYPKVETLVQQTEYIVYLSQIDEIEREELEQSQCISSFEEVKDIFPLKKKCYTITGALTDKLVNIVLKQESSGVTLVVKDFTKLFVSKEVYHRFIKKGCRLAVEKKAKLIAVCINPTSPYGNSMISSNVRKLLSLKVNVPVIDIFDYDET